MRKIFLSMLMSLFVGLCMAETIPYEYTITDNSAHTVGIRRYTGNENSIEIPSVIYIDGTEYTVTSIDTAGFYGLASVTVPSTVTSIAFDAFNGTTHVVYNGTAPGNPWGAILVNGVVDGYFVYTDEYKYYLAAYTGSDTLVRIPDNVHIIGQNAFASNHIITTVIISSVDSIESRAFSSCTSLVDVRLSNSVRKIGEYAFGWCTSLKTITIPTSVSIMGNSVFSGCNSLTIHCDASSKPEGWHNNWVASWNPCPVVWNVPDYSMYEYVITNENAHTVGIRRYTGNENSIEIPSVIYIDGTEYTVTSIDTAGFYGLASVTVPSTVTSIAFDAFNGTTHVVYNGTAPGNPWGAILVNGVVDGYFVYTDEYKYYLAAYTGNDTLVRIPDNVRIIGQNAFASNHIITTVIISSVDSIESRAFSSCTSLVDVRLSNSVRKIGEYAFGWCTSLKTITIPTSVSIMGNSVFSGCNSLTIHCDASSKPEGWHNNWVASWNPCPVVWNVPDYSMYEYVITNKDTHTVGIRRYTGNENSIEIPSVIYIDGTEYTVTSIDTAGFYGLASVTVPSTVTSIASDAFNGTTHVVYNGTAPGNPWGAILVNGVVDGKFVYTDEYKDYLAAYTGNDTLVRIPENVRIIGQNAFANNHIITTVIISSVDSIESKAFSSCTSLVDVILSSSVKKIGQYAFGWCTSLKTITIPTSVMIMGNSVFSGCNSLTIHCDASSKPEGWHNNWVASWNPCPVVWNVPDVFFSNRMFDFKIIDFDRNIVSITKYIGDSTYFYIPSTAYNNGTFYTVAEIGDSAFCNNTQIYQVILSSSVRNIRYYAFGGCNNLWIEIPETVDTVDYHAFYGCGSVYCDFASKPYSWNNKWAENCSLVVWKKANYHVSVRVNNPDYGTVTGLEEKDYHYGDSLFLTAVPNDGYKFTNWYNDSTGRYSTNEMYIAEVRGHVCLTANFEPASTIVVDGDWVFSDKTKTTLLAYNGSEGWVTIPDGVVEIADSAFKNNTKLYNVKLPSSVRNIRYYAFGGCNNLWIEIPETVDTVDYHAFYGCESVYCDFASKPYSWNNKWAENCSLVVWKKANYHVSVRVNNPDYGTVTGLEQDGYHYGDSLFLTAVPNDGYKFTNWYNDSTGRYSTNEMYIAEVRGHVCLTANFEPASTIVVDGDWVFSDKTKTTLLAYNGSEGWVTIPDGVVEIADSAFKNNTKLYNVKLPSSVRNIRYYAFGGCNNLWIEIPETIDTIDYHAFYGCGSVYCDFAAKPYSWNNKWAENCSLVVWKKANYHVSVRVNNPDYGTVTGLEEKEYHYGDSLFLTAVPNKGYMFTGWTNDSTGRSSTNEMYIEEVRGHISLTANFAAIGTSYTLTLLADTTYGVVYGAGTYNVPVGDTAAHVTISAYGVYGYTFEKWSDGSTNSYRDIVLYKDMALTASFVATEFTISYNLNGGTATNPEVYTIESEDFTLANPEKEGYIFTGWTGTNLTEQTLEVTIPQGSTGYREYTANFKKEFIYERIVDNMRYYITDTTACTASLIGYTDSVSFVRIPSEILSENVRYTVTSIGENAFCNCNMDSVEIPASVKVICSQAFANCTGIISLTIPNTVDSIGYNAFLKVKNIVYHGTATGEPWGALTLNGTFDGDFVYSSDNLTVYTGTDSVVAIPDSISSIGNGAFEGCTTVTEVVIPETVTEIGNNAFSGCENLTSISIPASVTSISEGAFANCSSLDSVAIPTSVTEIGNGAFSSCTSLSTIDIPESVTTIGSDAFAGCSKLDAVVIPESVTEIGNNAFSGCENLASVNIPSSVESINDGAFAGCSSLDAVVLPEKLTEIGNGAFTSCTNLSTIEIPKSVENIGSAAFAGCTKLDSVSIPVSVTTIGDSAFSGCTSLTIIGIPTSITSIGANTFSGCVKLDSVAIPESVTEIGSSAFNGCSSLSTIDIPSSVTQIGDGAFAYCSALTSVQIGKIDSAENNFKSKLIETLADDDDVAIGARAFFACDSLKSVFIPKNVTTIGDSAFAGCKALTIYCEAESKPEGWSDQWNPENCKVVWGYKAAANNNGEENQGGNGNQGEENQGGENTNPGTAVAESAANIANIYAFRNIIVVENADAEITVYDINGRMIAKAQAVSSRIELPMAMQGIYLVKVGNTTKRVAIN